jgi:hypothetical protein
VRFFGCTATLSFEVAIMNTTSRPACLAVVVAALLAAASCSSSSGLGSGGGSGGNGGAAGGGGVSGQGGAKGSGGSRGSGAGGAGGAKSSAGAAGSRGAKGSGDDGGMTGDSGSGVACTVSDAVCKAMNTGCTVGSYYLYDNQWNCGGAYTCGPESAYGCTDPGGVVSWVVTSNQPAGNTAVLTYPSMQDNFSSKPALGSFTEISATFEETSPHIGDYEVAWDCWFNDNANELMIWVDDYNQVPGGSKVASAVALGGRSYDVWWAPSSGTGGYVVFDTTATLTSGTVDLLGIFQYAAAHGWLPKASTVDQLSFGVEICSTGGKDATWTFQNYSITAH